MHCQEKSVVFLIVNAKRVLSTIHSGAFELFVYSLVQIFAAIFQTKHTSDQIFYSPNKKKTKRKRIKTIREYHFTERSFIPCAVTGVYHTKENHRQSINQQKLQRSSSFHILFYQSFSRPRYWCLSCTMQRNGNGNAKAEAEAMQ